VTVSFAELRSEAAYDALLEGMPIVLSVMRGPRTAAELAAAGVVDPARADRMLARLQRAGLLREVGGRYEPIADVIEHTRQEGMITFLSRAVLPLVTRLADEDAPGFVVQLDLDLGPDEQADLHRKTLQPVLEAIGGVSDASAGEDPVPCTVVAIGTSDVPPAGEAGHRLIETVRRAARQRSSPGDASRAVLLEGHTTIGRASLARAEGLVRACAAELAPRQSSGKRPAYTLALVFCARPSRAGSNEVGDVGT
jgi:hypothetical protein